MSSEATHNDTSSNVETAEKGSPRQSAVAADTQGDSESAPPEPEGGYPEQRHAGKVGLGPNFHDHPSTGDKITGYKQEIMGSITRNHEKVQEGKDRVSGRLQKKQQAEEDAQDPFATGDDAKKKSSGRDETEDKTGAAPAAAGAHEKRQGEENV